MRLDQAWPIVERTVSKACPKQHTFTAILLLLLKLIAVEDSLQNRALAGC